ncbi:MAG: peroxiredoxin family protein [Planctomycetota bacterium]
MRSMLTGAALLLPLSLAAQGSSYESAAAAQAAIAAKFQAALDVYRSAVEELRTSEAYVAARQANDREETMRLVDAVPKVDPLPLGIEAVAAARRFGGDDAVRLLAWAVVKLRHREVARKVVDLLEERHMHSPALAAVLERADMVARLLGRERGPRFLAKVVEQSPHEVVRAWSLYWQSVALARRDAEASAALLARAEELARGHWLADKIRAPQFKQERLQLGMTAPDIEGEDVEGVSFKLSDYRGKVVVLDFWGFW